MKLGLGTVQFGSDYGISNRKGQTSIDEVRHILEWAQASGITYLDTAALYGVSEETLGLTLPEEHPFRIVTKTTKWAGERISREDGLELRSVFARSLSKMKQQRVYGLMLHQGRDLLVSGAEYLYDQLCALKAEGKIEKFGISAYTPEEVEAVMARFPLDLVQVPLNVLDQRMLRQGTLKALKTAGVEIHVRSVFLQGLLLMDPSQLHAYFTPIVPHLRRYHEEVQHSGLTPLEAAIAFAASIPQIDQLICGVNDVNQCKELLQAMDKTAGSGLEYDSFHLNEVTFIDPSQWKVR